MKCFSIDGKSRVIKANLSSFSAALAQLENRRDATKYKKDNLGNVFLYVCVHSVEIDSILAISFCISMCSFAKRKKNCKIEKDILRVLCVFF